MRGHTGAAVFQTHQGKTALRATVKAAVAQATENIRYNDVPGGYSNLFQIYGATLQKDNGRQALVSIFTPTPIFLSA